MPQVTPRVPKRLSARIACKRELQGQMAMADSNPRQAAKQRFPDTASVLHCSRTPHPARTTRDQESSLRSPLLELCAEISGHRENTCVSGGHSKPGFPASETKQTGRRSNRAAGVALILSPD